MTRVFITGIGVYCAGGRNEAEFADFLMRGGCGIRELRRVDASGLYANRGGEIDFPRDDFSSPTYRDIATKLSLVTAEMAVKNANLDLGEVASGDIGLVLGVTCGGMDSQEEWVRRDIAGWPQSVNILEESLFQTISQTLARHYDIQGPVSTVTIACAAGTNAIGYGFDMIRQGKAKVVLVGGADVITQLTFAGFCSLRAMSPDICRPFDSQSNGIALGDGCGILVLEEASFARQRGARLRAEVLGYGAVNDGYHGTTPSPDASGLLMSIRQATREAGVDADAIEYVNLHGTGTDGNDQMEGYAMNAFFGRRAGQVPVSCTKSSVGHTLGAAGAVETIAALLGMENGFMPPTVNITGVNPAYNVNLIANTPLLRPMNCFMNVNSAFAGNNAAVIIQKPEARPEARGRTKGPSQRIVITGLGVVLPTALSPQSLWQVLAREDSAIASAYARGENGQFPEFNFCQMSGMGNSVLTRQMDRYASLSVLSAIQAFKDAGIDSESGLLGEAGSVVGSGYGSLASNTKFFRAIAEQGNAAAKPVFFQKTVSNTASGFIAILAGAKGFNTTLNNGDISGLEAMRYGSWLLQSGKAAVLYAGGVDSICPLVSDLFKERGALAQSGPSVPFSASSTGAMITEGAAGMILETIEHARQRGKEIYGEILGWGQGFTGRRTSLAEITARSMRQALAESKLKPEDIEFIVCHANGNPLVDEAEWRAVEEVFAQDSVRVSSVKGKLGEAMGAGGVCSLAAGVLAARNGIVFGMGSPAGKESKTIAVMEKSAEMKLGTMLVNAIDHKGGVVSVVVQTLNDKA